MKVAASLMVLACGLLGFHADAGETTSFSERVAIAKRIEAQKETADYFKTGMYPAIGPALASAMRDCMSRPGASTEKFTVVADVSQNGEFIHIAHEPKTNTAACLAGAMASFRAPPPPTCDCGDLPIVIDMSITP